MDLLDFQERWGAGRRLGRGALQVSGDKDVIAGQPKLFCRGQALRIFCLHQAVHEALQLLHLVPLNLPTVGLSQVPAGSENYRRQDGRLGKTWLPRHSGLRPTMLTCQSWVCQLKISISWQMTGNAADNSGHLKRCFCTICSLCDEELCNTGVDDGRHVKVVEPFLPNAI